MARTRAKDYDEKRNVMLRGAAVHFARDGYDRSSMAGLAAELGVSKALLYHYYTSKEALLFDILENHLQSLLDTIIAADDKMVPPQERLAKLIDAVLNAYKDSDDEHKLQLETLSVLAEEQQRIITDIQRQIVGIFSDVVLALNPSLSEGRSILTPTTMSLFGMLNWFYTWFREGGSITRDEYARLASKLFIGGVKSL